MTNNAGSRLDDKIEPIRPCGKNLSVDMVNALYPEHNGWRAIEARAHNFDLFGQVIHPGQRCFIRQVGMGFADVERITEDSMNRLLDGLFLGNEGLAIYARRTAQETKERHAQELRDAALKMSQAGQQ